MPLDAHTGPVLPRGHADRSWLTHGAIALLIAAVLALMVGLAGEAWSLQERARLAERERQRAADALGQLRADVESELNATLYLTNGLIAYVTSHSTLDPAAIDGMLKVLFQQGRHVQVIAVAPANRVTHIYPKAGNEKIIGLYYPDVPDQWPAVERTIASGHPVLAGPTELKQGGVGLIYRVPVFLQPSGSYWGVVSMVLRSQRLFDKVGLRPQSGHLELAIRGRDGLGEAGAVFLGDPALFDDPDAVRSQVNTPGGTWQMAARPSVSSVDSSNAARVRAVLWAVGLMLGASVFIALHGVGRRLRAEQALRASEGRLQMQNVQLLELVQQLDEANEELKALNASRTRLLAAACHDLRQPAHALGMLADLAAERVAPRDRAPIDGIRRCSAALSDMLNMLLDMTQLEADRYQPVRSAVPLRELLQELHVQFGPVAEAKGLDLQLQDTDVQVDSDRHLLRRMLMNLLSNAIKYTAQGSVWIHVVRDADAVSITVQDTGPGIPPDQLDRVFADYVRLDAAQQPEGLGIGLSIVKRAATLLDIPLEIQSVVGQGTTVRLTLPASTAVAAGEEPPLTVEGRGRLIGVLENDENILAATVQLLSFHGFRVASGRDLSELTGALTSHGLPAPDLLISDLHLDVGHDGLQLIEELRRDGAWRHTAFILVTGDLEVGVAVKASALRVALAYKPLQPRRLLHLVHLMLTNRHAQGEQAPMAGE